MTIAHWPLEDRPREKLLRHGEEHLTDTELLAILLKTGVPGKTALDIARDLLHQFGSLKQLFEREQGHLATIPGIGEAKLAFLKASRELGRRCLSEPIQPGTVLNSSILTQSFAASRLRDYKNEVFACLFMDSRYRLLKFEELFHGTINEASVYPREILRRAMALNAASVILAHNHPSGQAIPSPADRDVTERIQRALALIDIRVIDHIVVGNPDTFSFAEAGLLSEV
jgi:DNA repair protein RadC